MFHAPPLPHSRGPVSQSLIETLLIGEPGSFVAATLPTGDPLSDDDLHLSLYICFELVYRGWREVDPAWEWDPGLLELRGHLEHRFLDELRAQIPLVGPMSPKDTVVALQDLVRGATGPSVSAFIKRRGNINHMREFAIHRSAYQLKEADPHTWALPRIPAGRAKSALVKLQYDEYGEGKRRQSHAELFADSMSALGLDPTYGHYLDVIPGATLATVNLMSMFGLRRELLGECVGHLTVFEMTSVDPMKRYAAAMRRLTGSEVGAEFYDAHVTADVAHQVIALCELVPGLLDYEPAFAEHIVFGAEAVMLLERRLSEHLLGCWSDHKSSLLPVETTPSTRAAIPA
ncbi:MAG: hypothetical protein QOF21_1138 [Actinomycetota bacterium]|jgi:hypothetical protein